MRTPTVAALLAAALTLAACGASKDRYANRPRPPATVNIAVAVTDHGVEVSPARIGAGPAVLLIANETDRSRDVTASGSCVARRTSSGALPATDTTRLPVTLRRGTCTIAAGGHTSRLTVGPERPSAQGRLLEP